MPASTLQLQGVGIQDTYLTANPQVSFFKGMYSKYLNFATETTSVFLNEQLDWGKRTSCSVPKHGHLLTKLWLHIHLPALVPASGTYASWCNGIGRAMFNGSIDLEIGGIVVDKIYPRLEDALINVRGKGLSELGVLKSDVYIASKYNAVEPVDLLIPLEFWFTREYTLALPIAALTLQDLRIVFSLQPFDRVINHDGLVIPDAVGISGDIIAEYVYLENNIWDSIKDSPFTFLVNLSQYNGEEKISADRGTFSTQLKFNGPIKELVFGVVPTSNTQTNNWFAYSKQIESISVVLESQKRHDNIPEVFFRLGSSAVVHAHAPTDYIYYIPWCLRGDDYMQPTGSLNASRFTDFTLNLAMKTGNTECVLYVFAIGYNLVTINNGMLRVEWVN